MTDYSGYVPTNTNLYLGDYTTSPSGVYYAYLVGGMIYPNTPTYSFWVVPGSGPSVSGCCLGYQPVSQFANAPNLGGFFASMQGDGNFVIYTSTSGLDQGTVLPVAATNSQQSTQGAYFAQVGDDGSFTIYSGASPSPTAEAIYTAPNNSHGSVTSINLTNITYDFAHANILSETGVGLYSADFINATTLPEQVNAQQNISYTQTATTTFAVSDAVAVGISANLKFGIPGVVQDFVQLSVTNTTTITHGKADSSSNTVTEIAGARPTIPALSTYNVQITGTAESYAIPYTWTGVATYQDGTTADIVGTGTFDGGSEGNFQVTTTCIIAVLPSTCAPGSTEAPATILPVPEPITAMLLPLGLLGVAAARRFRRPAGLASRAVG